MTARTWLAAAAVSAGSVAPAADPAPPAYSFGTLRAMPADAAKAKAEAWLKAVDKLDRAKFDAIWEADRPVADRVLDSLLLGKPEAAAVLADARDPDATPPTRPAHPAASAPVPEPAIAAAPSATAPGPRVLSPASSTDRPRTTSRPGSADLGGLPPLPPPITVRPVRSPLHPLRYELRRISGIGTGYLTVAVSLVTYFGTEAKA